MVKIKKISVAVVVVFLTSCTQAPPEKTSPSSLHQQVPQQQEIVEKEALLWKQTVLNLQTKEKWKSLVAITPLSDDFKNTRVWQDKDFAAKWQAWLRKKSVLSWSVGDSSSSVWKIAEGRGTLRPSIGLRKEESGTWWVVFVEPDKSGDGSKVNRGWPCEKSCTVEISTNGQTRKITAKAPLHQEWRLVHTLGIPMPRDILGEENQVWEVKFPVDDSDPESANINQTARFDMSNMKSVCSFYFGSCEDSK